ncbi:Mu transposase C-terminal domain-containing protein [Laspinema sp. A4]|uniref:Mu transposase C-terminal domain-containing protein n=1 Tax=Laspinema sp. D2d TaxID=2953686 RepID=UPI0021BAAECB|nr:Mu transposase C-terminal domain-containing protein [Laspinema sp. D2d]MCT7984516.1 Mu transposase C-terminal domain-containing protein [Laspinema sp. D2d]
MGETDSDSLDTTVQSVECDEKLARFLKEEDIDTAVSPILYPLLDEEAKLTMEVLESLREPCDRATYGEKLRQSAEKLGKSVRTVQRLVKKYEEKGLAAITATERSDKGHYRIDREWQEFILKTYKEGNSGSKKMTIAQVAIRVQARADQLGLDQYPSHMSVYRLLNPILERQQQKQKIRNTGWKGGRLSHKTRDGNQLDIQHSNQVWQCDHTKLDIMLVDRNGEILGRPWLTKITDSYSRCIMGIHLGFDAPSSQVVSLALRHAILPKKYDSQFTLSCEWGTYGVPEHLFTDGGKDFKSEHLKQIAFQLGFSNHLRDRPSEGGIEERSFGTLNTAFLSGFLGYLGSNVQQRPETAEAEACMSLLELHRLLVRYIVDNYNQRIDARSGDQTRFQRWQAGLVKLPELIQERQLDICLKKQTRRTIYRGGGIKFQNLLYRGSSLAAYAGETAIVRFDPRDITTIWVYHLQKGKEVYLAAAHALDLEMEELSEEEAKAASRKIRNTAKTMSNQSILAEVRDRDVFIKDKEKTRKERKKKEQNRVHPVYKAPKTPEPEVVESSPELDEPKPQPKRRRIFNYDELRQEYEE